MKSQHLNMVLVAVFSLFLNSGNGQTLDTLLLKIAENNPELKSLKSEYDAHLKKVDQVGQLPNPSIGFGIPVLRPETRLGPQYVMASVSQMFPWFGTLNTNEDVILSISEAKFERISQLKLELYYEVKELYYKLIFLKGQTDIIEQRIELFNVLQSISLSKVENGQTTTADVLRIQLVIQQLEQQLKVISNYQKSISISINQRTNESFESIISPIDTFKLLLPLDFDRVELENKILNSHPTILMLNHQIEASEQKQILSKKTNSPIIGLGVDYSLVGERVDANPLDNGRDILVPKIMLSIPLYRKSHRAKIEEETIIQEGLNYSKEAVHDKLVAQLLKYKLNFDNALLEIELHQTQINTTELAIEILMTNYSSTGKGFDDLLQLENQLLEHQVSLLKGQLNMYLAVAGIERLTDF